MSTALQKQEVFRTPRFRWNQKDFRLISPGGQPVSGRGGDIRSGRLGSKRDLSVSTRSPVRRSVDSRRTSMAA